MAKYLYSKYTKGYTPWSNEVRTSGYERYREPPTVYRYFNESTGSYAHSIHDIEWDGSVYLPPFIYNGEYKAVTQAAGVQRSNGELESYRKAIGAVPYGGGSVDFEQYTRTREYAPGVFIQDLLAEDGTYPDNGLHTDGYWYVKGKKKELMKFKLGAQTAVGIEGWANLGNKLYPIKNFSIRIGNKLGRS